MFKHRRPTLSQNFLHNERLVRRLVQKANFSPLDTVLEIGPGKGIITRELFKSAGHVLAIELDEKLVKILMKSCVQQDNLTVFSGDFLEFPLPATPYKVFANTPFAIEGEIIRKLLEAKNPPDEMYLIFIKDVALRWAGIPRESQFSILHKPWFDFELFHTFSRKDFIPVPQIESVMLKMIKRIQPLIVDFHKQKYQQFVTDGFGGGRRLDQNLSKYFSKKHMKNLEKSHDLCFTKKPSDLDLEEWVNLFQSLMTMR